MFQNILLVVFGGISAWFLVRMFPRLEKSATGAYKYSTLASPYAAVSVHPSPASCQAVQAVKGKRFVSNEAPRLPLEGCEAEVCHCVYRHHSDRRTGNGDRREIGGDTFSPFGDGSRNRRLGLGRREIDETSDLSWS